jgi:malonate-semialdehyde dehydrogenase (acetylating)/methylmalonate-semialdehyde dehydrogenase
VSVAVTVGNAQKSFQEAITQAAGALRVGSGLEDGVQMGPLINRESKARVESLIAQGESDGAKVVLDGRSARIAGGEAGNFIRPTILSDVPPASKLPQTEIFGPVLSLVPAESVDQALEILRASSYGNAASIFTSSGAAARKFRYEAPAGNIGVNIGVAAPMAYFPFSGWKDSFLGVLHGQGRDAVEFYTEKKVVIERWPKEWSRKF